MISTEELEKFHPEKYPRNDIGTSNLFATVWGSVLVYVTERKGFFVYDGKVWRKILMICRHMSWQKNLYFL